MLQASSTPYECQRQPGCGTQHPPLRPGSDVVRTGGAHKSVVIDEDGGGQTGEQTPTVWFASEHPSRAVSGATNRAVGDQNTMRETSTAAVMPGAQSNK